MILITVLFLAYCGSEIILRKLVGRKDVEDALSRLDAFTNEAGLLFARTLTSDNTDKRVRRYLKSAANGVFRDSGNDVRATKVLTEDIKDNVNTNEAQNQLQVDSDMTLMKMHSHDDEETIKVLAEDINDNASKYKVQNCQQFDSNTTRTRMHITSEFRVESGRPRWQRHNQDTQKRHHTRQYEVWQVENDVEAKNMHIVSTLRVS